MDASTRDTMSSILDPEFSTVKAQAGKRATATVEVVPFATARGCIQQTGAPPHTSNRKRISECAWAAFLKTVIGMPNANVK
jgi:hypothetical protein